MQQLEAESERGELSPICGAAFKLGWPIFLFLIPSAACAADTVCHYRLVSEEWALAHRVDDANTRISSPIVFRRDLDLDGREDLLVGQACGNHGCEYSIFLARGNGRYCLIDGELGMSVAPKLGLVDVQWEGTKRSAVVIITWMSAGATSGSYERYRLADGRITKLCEIWYGVTGVPSEETAEAAKSIVERPDGGDRCRGSDSAR